MDTLGQEPDGGDVPKGTVIHPVQIKETFRRYGEQQIRKLDIDMGYYQNSSTKWCAFILE